MRPAIERFLQKITVTNSGCWEWQGYTNSAGYGQIAIKKRMWKTHRFIYEYYHGEIKSGMVIHHKCYNPSCSNLLHLDQRTSKENTMDKDSSAPSKINALKTHCKLGHEYTEENTYYDKEGRDCKKCIYLRGKAFRQRKKDSSLVEF